MAWISEPLGYYGLLAVGLVLSIYLFISLKAECAHLRHRLLQQQTQTQELIAELRRTLGTLERSLQEHEQQEDLLLAARAIPGASINLTKRSQMLRMYRRGESAEQICATLHVPRSEVDLLVKVQKALAEPSA